jgi:hypothetical protein
MVPHKGNPIGTVKLKYAASRPRALSGDSRIPGAFLGVVPRRWLMRETTDGAADITEASSSMQMISKTGEH